MNEARFQINLFSRQKTQSFILRFDDEREVMAFMGLKVINPEIIIAELSRIEENIISRAENRAKSNQIIESFNMEPPKKEILSPKVELSPPTCHYCNSSVWDNRENKKTTRMPDFRCKECKAVAWVQKDGSLRWKEEKKY